MILSGSPSPKRELDPRQEEERRKILKMLVTPQHNKRTQSSVSFDSMVIKAARSAESINQEAAVTATAAAGSGNGPGSKTSAGSGQSGALGPGVKMSAAAKIKLMKLTTPNKDPVARKESSQSLQIPSLLLGIGHGSSGGGGSHGGSTDRLSAHSVQILSPDTKDKKVTFSQVVDQMACSMSDSSSMSDLSSCTEDFKHNVSSHVPSARTRQGRKLFRYGTLCSRGRAH